MARPRPPSTTQDRSPSRSSWAAWRPDFPATTLDWDAANLTFTNHPEANRFVRRQYRQGWGVEGL